MFYGYHITINRKTSDIDAAYKIFFIILELISDYQLSSLFQIIILLEKSTRRGAFFHVFFLPMKCISGSVTGFHGPAVIL